MFALRLFISAMKSGTIRGWFKGPNYLLSGMVMSTAVPIGKWTHIAAVMNTDVGCTWYMNGVLDSFYNISGKRDQGPYSTDCVEMRIGAKHGNGQFSISGTVDDVKVWYNGLSAEGRLFRNYYLLQTCLALTFFCRFI